MDRADDSEVRRLLDSVRVGALGTLDAGGGPYVSLVLVAVDGALTPVFLLSGLARHTRNLRADPRASLLLDAIGGQGDGVSGSRITLIGQLERAESSTCRDLMLARHPSASTYIDFADFSFYRLVWTEVHLVAGFGRISTLPRSRFSATG